MYLNTLKRYQHVTVLSKSHQGEGTGRTEGMERKLNGNYLRLISRQCRGQNELIGEFKIAEDVIGIGG